MKKMTLILFGAFVFAFTALAATWTDPDTEITWTYTVSNGKASVGSGRWDTPAVPRSTTGVIAIPSMLSDYPVTSIGYYAFRNCSGLTSVTIPSSVTSIDWTAFAGCGGMKEYVVDDGNENYKSENGLLLTKNGATLIAGVNGDVTIPEGVTSIGDYAFYGCSGLTSVTIPSSVTSIGGSAFAGCGGMKEYVVDDGNENYKSENGLLLTKNGATLIAGVNGDVTIPEGVTSIDGGGVLLLQRADERDDTEQRDEHWRVGVCWLQWADDRDDTE